MLSRCLTLWGWLADEAPSVSAALDSFKRGSYDLLLCDVDLPDGDGISLAQSLLKVKPSLIVIIASGDPHNLERARKGGLAARLGKPFALDDLRVLIDLEYAGKATIGRQVIALEKQAPPNGPAHVLLVEDDPAQLADAWGILEAIGCRITAAESAEAALREVERTRFDVILTDNILPGMTGFQALPRLRASGAPVIVMSSQHGPDTEKDARLLGAAAFIKKPLVVKELSRLIRQSLDCGVPSPGSPDRP
ncbi:MAG: response regulator [Elusimicrobia bacterium]|nr:response regulator [Elusimicrobiota bacterium]MDE2510331.1 response regulator [Elusimicrobiota bacterium]